MNNKVPIGVSPNEVAAMIVRLAPLFGLVPAYLNGGFSDCLKDLVESFTTCVEGFDYIVSVVKSPEKSVADTLEYAERTYETADFDGTLDEYKKAFIALDTMTFAIAVCLLAQVNPKFFMGSWQRWTLRARMKRNGWQR